MKQTKLQEATAVLIGGASWSISFLVVMTALHAVWASATVVAMWVLKIAWSIVHTWVSRQKGKAAALAAAAHNAENAIAAKLVHA